MTLKTLEGKLQPSEVPIVTSCITQGVLIFSRKNRVFLIFSFNLFFIFFGRLF